MPNPSQGAAMNYVHAAGTTPWSKAGMPHEQTEVKAAGRLVLDSGRTQDHVGEQVQSQSAPLLGPVGSLLLAGLVASVLVYNFLSGQRAVMRTRSK